MKNYNEIAEKNLMEMAKREERQNKRLMASMWTILITSSIFYIGIILISIATIEKGVLLGTIIGVSTAVLVVALFIALKFEVDAGYYECKGCHHKFVPTYKDVLLAPHMATTRYIKCPECHKRTWAKKVMAK